MDADALSRFVADQIQKLRPKLLDFSRNNPLVATRLSERSGSTVRVVDELPFEIFQRLLSDEMQLTPLPPLDDDPKDEKSDKFQAELALARLNDQTYISAVDEIDEGAEDAAERLIKIERDLKDRVRERLEFPPRQTKGNFSLQQHAKNNKIDPSYDLPTRDSIAEDGRHTDNLIQTLLLPDTFVRRLDSINTKCRTYLQETGIDVFKVAFGFLEWADTDTEAHSFAPLIIMPAVLSKRRTPLGRQFWIKGDEAVESNIVITEKFRIEWGVEFPQYDPGQSVETYFDLIESIKPKGRIWRVRRQVAVGVFPSARMAMYHDLAPDRWDFGNHSVINTLFRGGSSAGSVAVFGDEYPVDSPEIEAKVEALVSDADSSQFSAIVDVMDGKNLAVEGPPGTGKSQTIVNTIAAAVAVGKKVLFVAEKTAALDVVWSRLQAYGLGEFVLPLTATRSSREDVIASVRDRLNLIQERDLRQREENLRFFDMARSDLTEYAGAIGASYEGTDQNVFEVLWRQLSSRAELDGWPSDLLERPWPDMRTITDTRLEELCHIASQTDDALHRVVPLPTFWSGIAVSDLDPYEVKAILTKTASCAFLFGNVELKESELAQLISVQDPSEQAVLLATLERASKRWNISTVVTARRLLSPGKIESLQHHLSRFEQLQKERLELRLLVKEELDAHSIVAIEQVIGGLQEFKLEVLDSRRIAFRMSDVAASVSKCEQTLELLEKISSLIPNMSTTQQALAFAAEIAESVPLEVLALRSTELSDPSTWSLLKIAKNQAEQLTERLSLLKQRFRFSTLNPDVVRRHLQILANAGALSFVSSSYREARSFYRSLTGGKKFDLESAVKDLGILADVLEAVEKFKSDSRLNKLLGVRFSGVDTDFSTILDLIAYYERIETTLAGLDALPLRQFLVQADRSLIKAFPRPSTILGSLETSNLDAMRRRLADLKIRLADIEAVAAKLSSSAQVLQNVEGKSLQDLTVIRDRLALLQNSWREEQGDLETVSLVGKSLLEINSTELESLVDAIGLATEANTIAPSLREIFLTAVERESVPVLLRALAELGEVRGSAVAALDELSRLVQCEFSNLTKDKDAASIVGWLDAASKDNEGLVSYSRVVTLRNRLREQGFGSLVDAIESSSTQRTSVRRAIRAVVAETMARDVYRIFGKSLAKFDGDLLNSLRARFANLDRSLVSLARRHLRATLIKNASPPTGNGFGPKSTWTELSLIENECTKQKRFISVRDLTARAGRALVQLKPCWMMSPLSVAQYIEKGAIKFDLVVIDEASQMTPENAVGALVRSGQAMIVGDTNQLPPTSFFRKMLASDEDDDDDYAAVTDESILERANAAFRPPRRLKWHYRSRHSGLIRLSNHDIYGDGLTIFPSASEDDPSMGVDIVEVNGTYSSGTNANEAAAMIAAISRHMRDDGDRSLGVVTINQKQRDLILEEFEMAVSKDPRLARFVSEWEERNDGLEPFFIKNLENVQGDERDVIFIGTVYGPDKDSGKVAQRFGPISGLAGRRRLNVLFTRAKQKIVTFSSMRANDIAADEAVNPGAYMLKRWLEYSRTGVIEGGRESRREPDSPFEQYVMDQLVSFGCEPVPQVGSAGYFIDIGVRHPQWPHGFIMGIECDGAPYHSSKSARDRDRYRQEILEGLGWHLYRIWSTDWFQDPLKSAERLKQAVVERLRDLGTSDKHRSSAQTFEDRRQETKDEQFEPEKSVVVRSINREEAEMRLIRLRENEVMEEFPDSDRERGLLRKSMIKVLLNYLPQDEAQFRANIPLSLREKTDSRQMKYLPTVLEILCQVKS